MVNYTKRSQAIDGTWQKDSNYELPVPMNKYECWDCINEMDEILGLFESDDLYDDNEYLTADAVNLLLNLDPRHVEAYSDDWEHSVKLWLFRYEVVQTCQTPNHDKDHKNYLISVCQEYLCLLYDRLTEFGEDIR